MLPLMLPVASVDNTIAIGVALVIFNEQPDSTVMPLAFETVIVATREKAVLAMVPLSFVVNEVLLVIVAILE